MLSGPIALSHLASVIAWPKPTSTHGSGMYCSWPISVRNAWYGTTAGSLASEPSDVVIA